MKKFLLSFLLLLQFPSFAFADWELLHELSATYTFHVTEEGLMLMTDLLEDGQGGIYYSEDKGATWQKSSARGYQFNRIYEYGDYVYAVGGSARIARSEDGGRTWDMLNYSRAIEHLFSAGKEEASLESTACYALAEHAGKLYAADFVYGVLVSEDWGESWTLLDRKSLMVDGSMDPLYNLVEYKGKLYAMGMYQYYQFVDSTQKWKTVRSSNFMAVWTILDDVLYVGQSRPNEDENSPFLMKTTTGSSFTNIKHPAGTYDTNVRALHSDFKNIYVGMQTSGIYFSPDKGKTFFNISKGLPHIKDGFGKDTEMYLYPLTFDDDDEYLYVAIYNEAYNASQHTSGVYRLSKQDIEELVAGISQPVAGNEQTAQTSYDLQGRTLTSATQSKGIVITNGKKMLR